MVDSIIGSGIDTLYCLPGVQNDPLFDVLWHNQNKLRVIHSRHEQGAAYMAMGAALATGKPQACCLVPGVGFLNAAAALATAYSTNAPVLTLLAHIPLNQIGRGYGALHEVVDQTPILRTMIEIHRAHRHADRRAARDARGARPNWHRAGRDRSASKCRPTCGPTRRPCLRSAQSNRAKHQLTGR